MCGGNDAAMGSSSAKSASHRDGRHASRHDRRLFSPLVLARLVMETVVFACAQAPVLAQSAARCFNELADAELARAYATDAVPAAVKWRARLVVMLGRCETLGWARQDIERWPGLDPTALLPGQEGAHL